MLGGILALLAGPLGPGRVSAQTSGAPGARPPAPPAAPPSGAGEPGVPAPRTVIVELQRALALGIQRFQAKDLEGVLALISDDYWTSPFTKGTVRVQLQALFQLNQAVSAQVAIDAVRLVGEHAWVYTTGEVSGQLPVVNQWAPLFVWERQLEVARRERGAWRLYGYQQ